MGNLCCCLSPKKEKKKLSKRFSNSTTQQSGIISSSNRWNRIRNPSKREKIEDAQIQEQAIAAAILFKQHQQQQQQQNEGGTSIPFDRSTSLRHSASSRKQSLPRSSSTRARSSTDPLLPPYQLDAINVDDLETKHFVLVHGGGFGAWCWYKTITLLTEAGFKVDAIDLTGAGVNSFVTDSVTSLSQYVNPLTNFIQKHDDKEKVILVAHDLGGACISYVMELFPLKVAKAIFVAAAMLTSGQSTLDMFTQQAGPDGLMPQAQTFIYANGNDHAPTAIELNKSLLKDLLFNQSPTKDVALASVSMRSIPFAPVLEKLSLTDENHGAVRKFYIETTEDNAIPLSRQQSMITANPPEQVYRLKGADHSPFFSKPQALHKLLVEISRIPSVQSTCT
ncbi:putative methylesterase 11, chloroplastic [Papaver somniferum]|uniref:putative methylesterase 11, chloroplastic n=1 Tax=Papaver somniferum TaxID=3469 RepID=UPI000E6FA8F1|nr:putative methylesterase 11, chloroplastic [Papaver somniferum]